MELCKVKEVVAKMTLEEKASLCSGLDFWHTKGVERLQIPSVMVSDGPHGLRKQEEDADHWDSIRVLRQYVFQQGVQWRQVSAAKQQQDWGKFWERNVRQRILVRFLGRL